MIDTVACFTTLDEELPLSMFQGGSVQEQFDTGQQNARLWHNPRGEYEPRVTWWPAGRVLKLEWACSKYSYEQANEFVQRGFGVVSDVRDWTCQRIDYYMDWDTPHVAAYLAVLSRLRVARMLTHPYEQAQGVVWKAGNRWIKFYDKSREQGESSSTVLRFEVSNYKPALVYMCENWFKCQRTVGELMREDRARDCLSRMWDRLGLNDANVYGGDVPLLVRLHDLYGASAASALYVHSLLREFGSAAVSRGFVSASTYQRWKAKLKADGLLVLNGRDEQAVDVSLPVLRLPEAHFGAEKS